QPTSCPRSSARYTPPEMDMWAPRRSGIEGALHRLQLALEPADLPAQRLASPRPPEEAVLHEGQEGARDLLGAPAARGVVPLVDPVQHPEQAEDHEPGQHVPKDAAPDAFRYDRLHALVVAVLLRGKLAREARGEARLLAEEDGEEGAVGDDEAHVLPDDPAELVLRGQARAQDEAELARES